MAIQGINPLSSIAPSASVSGASQAKNAAAAPKGADFGDMLKGAIERIDTDQQASATAVQDLLTGKSDGVLPVVSAVAKADMSFKLLIGVRNKVIEAYKQTMNMQI
jgi:flagellar hook-basal body complex protein FliE